MSGKVDRYQKTNSGGIRFYHNPDDSSIYTDFRMSGTSPYDLSLVYYDGSSNSYCSLMTAAGDFIKNKADKSHASSSASTYGAGTASYYGHVKLSDNYSSSGGAASASVAASSLAVYNCYSNRAPISHASSSTTYGIGTASNYGHIKLTDTYYTDSGAASSGVGLSSTGAYNLWAGAVSKYTVNCTSDKPYINFTFYSSAGSFEFLLTSFYCLIFFSVNLKSMRSDDMTSFTSSTSYIRKNNIWLSSSLSFTEYSAIMESESDNKFRVKIGLSGPDISTRVIALSAEAKLGTYANAAS